MIQLVLSALIVFFLTWVVTVFLKHKLLINAVIFFFLAVTAYVLYPSEVPLNYENIELIKVFVLRVCGLILGWLAFSLLHYFILGDKNEEDDKATA